MTSHNVHENILSCVGGTPLVRLNSVTKGIATEVWAKCEFMNPGSSVKDRIGAAIIDDAVEQGNLLPGGTVVEATSGNTGVGLALAATIRGFKCIFTIPDKMSTEKVKLLKAFGAKVIVTPTVDPDHPEYYVTVAKNIVKSTPNSVLANQFYNQVNPETHYKVTGPELWEQVGGKVDALVAGLGTGGTISGIGKFLKEKNPDIRVVGADPLGSVYKTFKETGKLIEGGVYKVEGIGQDKVPETSWLEYIDEFREVNDRDSFLNSRRLTREEALFVGGSAGTALTVALQVAEELNDPNKKVVVILPDTGERYLSKLHSDEWMRENQFLEEPATNVQHLLLAKTPTMDTPVVSVKSSDSVKSALASMSLSNVSQVPVIDNGESVGSLDEAHLMGLVLEKGATLETTVGEVMEAPFPVVCGEESLDYVSRLLGRGNSALLVRNGNELTGILTRFDIIHSMAG